VLDGREVGVLENRDVGGDGGGHPFHLEFGESTEHASYGGGPVVTPHDQLADEVVVELADLIAGFVAGVESGGEAARRAQGGYGSR